MAVVMEVYLGGVKINVYRAEVEKSEKRAADTCVFRCSRGLNVSLGQSVKVRLVSGVNVQYIFSGSVVKVDKFYDYQEVTAFSDGAKMDSVRVFPAKVYIDKAPEFIVQDLVTYAGLTYGSTWSSGVTISNYEAVGTVGENVRKLADVAGADFWGEIDNSGNYKFMFQPASSTDLGKSYVLVGSGANARRIDKEDGLNEVVNAAEVYGKIGKVFDTRNYNAISSGFGYIVLENYPIDRKVSIKDVVLQEGKDFSVKIWSQNTLNYYLSFSNLISGTSTNPTPIKLELTFDNSQVAYSENSSSISSYGKRSKAYIVEGVVSQGDLQVLADKIVNLYSSPRISLRLRKAGLEFGLRDGGFVRVTDSQLGLSNATFVVKGVKWKWPEGYTEIYLGQFVPEIYDFERSLRGRIEEASRSSYAVSLKNRATRLYMSGGSSPALVDNLGSAVASSYGGVFISPNTWLTLDIQISGLYTRTYTRVGHVYMNTSSSFGASPFYSTPIFSLSDDFVVNPNYLRANASNQLTFGVAVFYENNYYGTRYRLYPSSGYATYTFTGVKRIMPTTLGWTAFASYNATDGTFTFYVGVGSGYSNNNGSHLHGIGVELV